MGRELEVSQVVIPESAIYTTSPVEVFKAESVVRLGAAIAAGDQQHRLSCLGQPQHGLETVRLAYCGSGSGLVPTKDEASGRKTQSTGRGPTQTGFRKGQIDLDPSRNKLRYQDWHENSKAHKEKCGFDCCVRGY